MDAIKALEERKSARSYLQKEVEEDKLATIIAAGKHAPNAGSFQISVITNQAVLTEINDISLEAMKSSGNDFLVQRASIPGYRPLYGAPVLLMLSSPENGFAQANTSCAATCMTVAATALGLGSCYVVTPTFALNGKNELAKKVGILDGNTSMCGVLIGYEAKSSIPSAERPEIEVNYVK